MESHEENDEAREALEMIGQVRKDVAARAASPKGYYALAGFGEAVAIVGVGSEGATRVALVVVGLAILVGAMRWYSAHTGVVTWASLREPGAWRAWVMVAVAIAAVVVAAAFGFVPAVVGAVATFATWALLGPVWDRAWVASLGEQP